jgi:uncharacterized protein YdhG (YjbR/CyaY superfamily)
MSADRAERPRRPRKKADPAAGENEVREAIATMTPEDRAIAERLHAVITSSAPALTPRLWYGMPAYAKDGKVVVFFRGRGKFKERYMTLGFNQSATLDDGHLWPVAFALTDLTAADEAKIGKLVKKAAR